MHGNPKQDDHDASGRDLPPLNIDAHDGDWIKRGTWDIPASNIDELREWLMSQQFNPSDFKNTEAYKANVERMPWLRDLEGEER
ncbi:MAG TPA: hypothetical protein VIM33_05410 [Gaiellaceae bacterium]|jgi:hypothetical protein